MFNIFHKKKHHTNPTPEEAPPIPGPNSDDFVIVNNDPPTTDINSYRDPNRPLYPPVDLPPGVSSMPAIQKKEIHSLHGVPFKLSKELTGDSNEIFVQLSEILAFCTQRLNMNSTEYDFSVEKSVLAES